MLILIFINLGPGLGPENVTVRIVKATIIGLQWDPPTAEYINDALQGYHTFYREAGSKDFIKSHTGSSLATQRDIKNLKPGTEYTFKFVLFQMVREDHFLMR